MVMFLTLAGKDRVQNFELYAICENCFNNKRFIEKRFRWLIIVNPIASPRAYQPDLQQVIRIGK
jgi:hypothetical protein